MESLSLHLRMRIRSLHDFHIYNSTLVHTPNKKPLQSLPKTSKDIDLYLRNKSENKSNYILGKVNGEVLGNCR